MTKPWLWLGPLTAHDLAPVFLNLAKPFIRSPTPQWRGKNFRHLQFLNPLGIAGGVDKNADTAEAWTALGAGFVEIGTITPRPQNPNQGIIVDRDSAASALWNRMGFPSKGVEVVAHRLARIFPHRKVPYFINIGKNRETSLEQAHSDYAILLTRLIEFGDAFVLNISSPNTAGLRDLLLPQNFQKFLKPIANTFDQACKNKTQKPLLLLKLSPDLSETELSNVLNVSVDLGLDGWICGNTTISRNGTPGFPAEGGVSGAPLSAMAKNNLVLLNKILGARRENKLVVSAGGVMTADDVHERLDMGADLVQVYAALIFSGPLFFRQVARQARFKT